jgi:hypothetical protein
MSAPLRIGIAGRFLWHSGSSHALLGYVRAGERLGFDVRASLLGEVDKLVRSKVPTASPDWSPDLMVLVCEERFMTDEARQQLDVVCPRSRRVLIDPDGRYSPLTAFGNDANHPSAESRDEWVADFDSLSDVILQPSLGDPAPGTQRFLYFGIDVHRDRPVAAAGKPFDIVYVGNNWYRWHDMVWLVNGLAPVRSRGARIAVFGQWWTGEPAPGCESQTASEAGFLAGHGVETFPSAPFDDVERTMGLGRLSPILIRPVLAALQLATPRMFETFAADTVPMLPPSFRYARALYGDRVDPLLLPDDPAAAVAEMLEHPDDCVALAKEIRAALAREHTYEVRLTQLVEIALSQPAAGD